MTSSHSDRPSTQEQPEQPMKRFSARRMTRRENVIKQEIDAYHVSDVDDTAVIYMGDRTVEIYRSLDLPDAECDGLTFKQRLVRTDNGDCLLIARWKPDRQMRRTAPELSQKWFVEKKLFPPDTERLFSRIEKRLEEANEDQTD